MVVLGFIVYFFESGFVFYLVEIIVKCFLIVLYLEKIVVYIMFCGFFLSIDENELMN